jgi:hypothetical protein
MDNLFRALVFTPTAWENLAQGKSVWRRCPGYNRKMEFSLKGWDKELLGKSRWLSQSFRLPARVGGYPGRRRNGSPWAKFSRAVGLKTKIPPLVYKFATNFCDAKPAR